MPQLPHEQASAPIYEPTPEGLGLALDDTIAQHLDAVVHTEAAPDDSYGRTGGDKLTLYPDPSDPRKTITVSPVGSNADTRIFSPGNASGLHVMYNGRKAPGSGVFRVGGVPGTRFVTKWNTHPQIPSAIDPSLPESQHMPAS